MNNFISVKDFLAEKSFYISYGNEIVVIRKLYDIRDFVDFIICYNFTYENYCIVDVTKKEIVREFTRFTCLIDYVNSVFKVIDNIKVVII